MPLLNYTTTVRADKTAAEVAAILVKAGATAISTEYRAGSPVGLRFAIDTTYGRRSFALPINPAPVLAALGKSGAERRYRNLEQAERVAWRILKDWVEAQVALIQTGMAAIDQVLLPYMLGDDGDTTVYDAYLAQQPALTAGAEA